MYWGQMYTPSIEPSATELYYTRSVWHVTECKFTRVRCTPTPWSLHLVVQSPTTPECRYTRMQISQVRCPPCNWPKCSIGPLHHNADILAPANQTWSYVPLLHQNADITRWHIPPSGMCYLIIVLCNPTTPESRYSQVRIKPNTTDLYYTWWVWHVNQP